MSGRFSAVGERLAARLIELEPGARVWSALWPSGRSRGAWSHQIVAEVAGRPFPMDRGWLVGLPEEAVAAEIARRCRSVRRERVPA